MVAHRPAAASRGALLRPTAVNAILAEVREARAAGGKIESLMRGEPDFRTPPHIVEACAKALRDGRTAYPDNRGEGKLRQAVTAKLAAQNHLRYDAETEILVTTGATQGIAVALLAMLNEGDEVLLPDPIYDAYQSPIRLAGGVPRAARSQITGGRFTLEIEALEAAWTPAARALLLNTPWNPTGTVFTTAELAQIGAFVERHNLLLISDEIYEAMTYGEHRHVSPAALSESLRARTILVNSLSKSYAMTGWRVGYSAAPREWIDAMLLVLQQSSRGPATFVQDAAAEALTGPQECVAEMRAEYARRREEVLDRLAGIPGVRALAPEGGFFAMVDISELRLPSDQARRRLLREAGVVVVHGAAYGPGGEGTLRVSFASGGEILARGLEKLREGLCRIAERP
jgi:aspartate/methionine/tyrosine aminotransferase